MTFDVQRYPSLPQVNTFAHITANSLLVRMQQPTTTRTPRRLTALTSNKGCHRSILGSKDYDSRQTMQRPARTKNKKGRSKVPAATTARDHGVNGMRHSYLIIASRP